MNFKNLSKEEKKFAFLVNYKIMLANQNIMLFLIHEEINKGKIKTPKITEIKKPKSSLSEIKPAIEKTEYIRKLLEAIIRSNIIKKNI